MNDPTIHIKISIDNSQLLVYTVVVKRKDKQKAVLGRSRAAAGKIFPGLPNFFSEMKGVSPMYSDSEAQNQARMGRYPVRANLKA